MKEFGAVILAAGSSKRLGFNKLTLRINGEPVLRKAVFPFIAAGIEKILVVTGVESKEIHDAMAGYHVEFVENKDHILGMSTSVRAAMPFIANEKGVFFHLGDKPFIEKETIDDMMSIYRRNKEKIIVPSFQGKKGHPVLINSDLCKTEMMSLTGDKGLREIIEKHTEDVLFIKGTEGSLFDIDTVEDIRQLQERGYVIEKG
jgi:molybdenum cofactor cytidylyltransferase